MAKRYILITNDLAERNMAGKRTALLLRKLTSELAQKLKLQVKFLYVDQVNKKFKKVTPLKIDQVREWRKRYQAMFEAIRENLPPYTEFILKAGSAEREIIETINTQPRPEIVVMGTHGKQGLRRLFLGSVAEDVLRNSPRPLLIVGPTAQQRNPSLTGKNLKMLVLTDLEKTSRAAEQYALSFAKLLGAKAVLYHAVGDQVRRLRENIYMSGYVPLDIEDTFTTMREDATKTLEKKRAAFEKYGVHTTTKINTNETDLNDDILAEVLKGYHLIVMGTHSRNAVMTALVGSTARETILKSPVPVVLIKS